MYAVELIEKLRAIVEAEGDVPVFISGEGDQHCQEAKTASAEAFKNSEFRRPDGTTTKMGVLIEAD